MLLAAASAPEAIASARWWPDHTDELVRWALPGRLEMHTNSDGSPGFLLSRWRDPVAATGGGLLHLELSTAAPDEDLADEAAAAGCTLRTAPLVAARFRLQLRAVGTEAVSALGEWRSTPPAAEPLVAITDALDSNTAQILTASLSDAAAVEVAVVGTAAGVAGGLQVLVLIDTTRLRPLLGSLLDSPSESPAESPAESPSDPGPTPQGDQSGVTVEAIVAALLSVPESENLIRIESLGAEPLPGRPQILAELAHRLLDDLFIRVDETAPSPWTEPRYALGPDHVRPQPQAYDLRTYRPARVGMRSTWSLSGWAAGLDQDRRAALFPELDGVAVFGTVPVVVVCPVPIDPDGGVRRVQVDVSTTGSGGMPSQRSFSFTGQTTIARFTAVYPALTHELALSARAFATLSAVPGAEPAWPRVLPARSIEPEGTLLTVTAGTLGVDTVPISAEPAVFDTAARLDLTVRSSEMATAGTTLGIDRATAVLAYPATGDGAALRVLATRADDPLGTSVQLPDRILADTSAAGGIAITAVDLEDPAPTEIRVDLADPNGRSAYAAVALVDPTGRGRTLTIDPTTPVTWTCHRPTALHPLLYRWQLHYVARRSDGTTTSLRSTAWSDTDATDLTVLAPDPEQA